MRFKPLLMLILLALPGHLRGQDSADLLRKGNSALAAGLWELAALHYNDCLARQSLSASDKSQIAIQLAEAWIRGGKYSEARALLDQSFAAHHPAAPFWKGQALAGLGHFTEAIVEFSNLWDNPQAPHRPEAAFTMASLYLALDLPQNALDALESLSHTQDQALSAKARLYQVEVLLDINRFSDARDVMRATAAISPADRPLALFLEAQLLLRADLPAEAASKFQALVDEPHGQTLRHYHAAVVGLADALSARGNPDLATGFLLNFIQDHPDSPLLEPMFKRLLDLLPASPDPTDPILQYFAQWSPPGDLPPPDLNNTLIASAAAPTWSTSPATSELLAYALYHRAVALHRMPSPENRALAHRLLTRLRLEFPNHTLASRGLFLTAKRALEDGQPERAFGILDTLRESTTANPQMRGQAAFLEALNAAKLGDPKQAAQLFDDAAKSLAISEAQTAKFNAAILRMASTPTTTTLVQSRPPLDTALAADLEFERALSLKNPDDLKPAIESFLSRHPEHPRVPEARLAAAEAALAGPSPELAFARAQFDALTTAPDHATGMSASRIAMLKLRIDDLSNNSTVTIATAKAFLQQYPGDPAAGAAAFVLGRNLFQTGQYNEARLVLERLSVGDADAGRAQAAGLLAARSAALVPTSQSQQEALILFDKVIAAKGSLAPVAMLEKSRLMIDMNRLPEATAFLRKWFDGLPKTDPLQLPAGFLLGEALYAQGSGKPDSLSEALAVYDQLLEHADKQPALFNRLQYLRGMTLEKIPDEKDPSHNRKNQAFMAYYSVLETTSPPAEWHYFELCGLRALALLEEERRWPAAIACAKKIASFKGPRATEAASRANHLQLKYMIWED